MLTVVDKSVKIDKKDGRAAVKEDDKNEKQFIKGLEVRGKSVQKKANEEAREGITSIIVKGRKEQEKQRLYLCRLNSIQFEMKYSENKISELRIMIKEFREDDEDEAESISSIKN